MRLLLRVDEERAFSVPPQWTDVVVPDPELVIGGGRALVRLADLLELAELIKQLVGRGGEATGRKGNDAACVSQMMPQRGDVASKSSAMPASTGERCATYELDNCDGGGVIAQTEREAETGCRTDPNTTTQRRRRSSRRGP